MKRLARTLVLSLLVSGALSVAACESEETPTSQTPTGFEDVQFFGDTNLAALQTVLSRKAKSGEPERAVIDYPVQGKSVPAAPAATITWHTGVIASLTPAEPRSPGETAAPTGPTWEELFGGLRSAHASEIPVSGVVHYLVIWTPNHPQAVRVFTDQTSYTPDEATWNKLVATREQMVIEIITAKLEGGEITPDGGPFMGLPTTFSID